MSYMNLELNYGDHPKTRRLIGILGEVADVYPVRLWLYCGRIHPKDGRMKGYSAAEVEGVIGWKGETGAAVAAMVKVDYLKKTASGYECVDWHQHEGHLEAFSLRGKKAAAARWSKLSKGGVVSNASSMPEALQEGVSSNAPTELTVLSLPSKPTVLAEKGQPVDFSGKIKTAVGAATDRRADAMRQVRLLDVRMPFGEHKSVRIVDLEPSYCQFVLAKCQDIGQELKDALTLRVKIKAEEVAR